MKVSKALLGAILVGITVQTTVSSCSKKDQNAVKPQSGEEVAAQPHPPNPDPNPDPEPCPACGMG